MCEPMPLGQKGLYSCLFLLRVVILGGLQAETDERPVDLGPSAFELDRFRLANSALLQFPQGDTLERIDHLVLKYTNHVRDQHDVSSFQLDSDLKRVACKYSWDTLNRGFFAHVNPDGASAQDRVAVIYRRHVGRVTENIWGQCGPVGKVLDEEGINAYAKRIVQDWMESPSLRKNLLAPTLTHTGICGERWAFSIRFTQVLASVRADLEDPIPHRVEAGSRLSVSLTEGSARNEMIYDNPSLHIVFLGLFS